MRNHTRGCYQFFNIVPKPCKPKLDWELQWNLHSSFRKLNRGTEYLSSNSRALPAFPFFESFVCSSLRLPAIYCSICYVYLLSHFICAHIFLSSFPHMRHVYLCVVVFRWSETFIHFGWRLIDVSAREKKIKIILFAVCTLHK